MDDDGAANDALGANELDEVVGHGALGVALGIGLNVAQVTNMAVLVGPVAVGLAMGVEVRAGGGAAVGVVTKGVDVHATLGIGIMASDVPGDGSGTVLGLLLEDNGAGDLGVTTDDSNSLDHFDGFVSKVGGLLEVE